MIYYIQKEKGDRNMDNPLSWFILLCIVIYFGVHFAKRAFEEMEERKNHKRDDEW